MKVNILTRGDLAYTFPTRGISLISTETSGAVLSKPEVSRGHSSLNNQMKD